MKIAIIGAGFAGLATAYFLLESKKAEVTLFEATKIGGGASGVASGLLHPYPGLSARRSQRGEEALNTAKQLLRIAEKHIHKKVALQMGILRSSVSDEQHERLLSHQHAFGDVQHLEKDLFLIHSGITVLSENYLEGLTAAITQMGGEFCFEKIHSLKQLHAFDHIVIAAGYGVREFDECQDLKVKFLKGQVLSMEGRSPFEKSFISKGYIAHTGNNSHFEIGSTYERDFSDPFPNFSEAKRLLSAKIKLCQEAKIIECKAAVRVCTKNHYLPIIQKVSDRAHVFTGLGSRGLLYHGLYGRMLAGLILC